MKRRSFHKGLLGAFGVTVLAFAGMTGQALAQYPQKAITIVCASGAGGINDVITRVFADYLSKKLGQPVVVENEPGAGSTIAIRKVSQATPDGYTLLTTGSGITVVPELYPNSKIDPVKDVKSIAMLAVHPLIVTIHSSIPAKDLQSLVEYAKAHPNQVTLGSNGRGSAGHLAGELLKKMSGAPIKYVPYRTTPEALNDLLGGRISMMITTMMNDHIQAGTLRGVGATTTARSTVLPDIPTLHEQGLKDYEAPSWTGMYAPPGTPQAVVDRLSTAIQEAMNDPGIQEKLKNLGVAAPTNASPQYLATYLKDEVAKWSDILKTAE
jgi:tripartite-type tricarboxylate transporter receptor subunit TctC